MAHSSYCGAVAGLGGVGQSAGGEVSNEDVVAGVSVMTVVAPVHGQRDEVTTEGSGREGLAQRATRHRLDQTLPADIRQAAEPGLIGTAKR